MTKNIDSGVSEDLVLSRENILSKLTDIFLPKAVEGHVLGSLARANADIYSDIDIWFTFNDDDFDDVYKNRFQYYMAAGELLHVCEPPQNAPMGGVLSTLLIKTDLGSIVVVDVCLCPLSTSFITAEGKKLFGVDLPIGTTGYNTKKVVVDKNYRIDFLICFIFNTIKKIARDKEIPLEDLFREYDNLSQKYNISVDQLVSREHNFQVWETIIANVQKVANEKQKQILDIITDFGRKII